jgi:hypothetical protein
MKNSFSISFKIQQFDFERFLLHFESFLVLQDNPLNNHLLLQPSRENRVLDFGFARQHVNQVALQHGLAQVLDVG